jgi:hypothetical protein
MAEWMAALLVEKLGMRSAAGTVCHLVVLLECQKEILSVAKRGNKKALELDAKKVVDGVVKMVDC